LQTGGIRLAILIVVLIGTLDHGADRAAFIGVLSCTFIPETLASPDPAVTKLPLSTSLQPIGSVQQLRDR
jgi:hypothetical protein